MEIISPIVGFFSTYVIDPIAAKFQVSRNLDDNKKELETSRDNLVARRDDQRGEVEQAKMQDEGVEESQEAKLWFSQVDGALTDVNDLLSDFSSLQNQYQQRCTRNCCFCWSRYKLSKKALKLNQVVGNLYERAQAISGWTATAPALQKGTRLDTVSIEGQPTTEQLKREIIDAVLDKRYVVVGLYGMGGVGKTTLLRHANEHFRHTDDFQSVIFTTVSATPSFVEIRKQIAQSLRLENWQDDEDLKIKLSRHHFSTRRKYLLIIDDMWEPIDFGEICIPTPTEENGCKILMASRLLSVVTRFVNSFAAIGDLKSIPVKSLPSDEAWSLFVQKVGEDTTSKPEIEPLARKILKKCGGLPLAVVVIGGTMSTRKTEGEWEDAIRELEQRSASNLEGMEQVFSILKFSFDKLESIEQQSLFLYCCLFPEDHRISERQLHYFAIGEETLMCDEIHTLKEMRNKVDVLVRKLLNSSMLEDAGGGCVKMHDVMRELGLWITSPTNKYQYSSKYIAKARARITEAPNASEWCKATKISLMTNEIESLPQLPDQCPQLHTLLLQECIKIKEIPQVHFLEHMPALRILDLGSTIIETLPPSISHLVNLRFLYLSFCESLQELPSEIGMLVQLISLHLGGCKSLRKLPVEMKKLYNLRHLDIFGTEKLKKIPLGLISGLHKLEELHSGGSGLRFYTNNVEELLQLNCLTSISIIRIRKVKVSHWLKPLAKCIHGLHLQNCVIDTLVLPDILQDSVDEFTSSCDSLTRVPTSGHRYLTLQECPDLKALLIVDKVKRNAFESLYELKLDRLDQLETICTGIPQPEYRCFTNLKYMKIQACSNLKELFTKGVTRLLKELKYLYVYRCSQLVKLISDDEDLDIDDAFSSLEEIYLCELPELTAICHIDLTWPYLCEAHVYLCPKLKRPPFGVQCADISLNDDMDSWLTQQYLETQKEEKEREEVEEREDNDEEEGLTSS